MSNVDIIDCIDEFMARENKYQRDLKIFSLICLDFCNYFHEQMSSAQKNELDAANYYWKCNGDKGDSERLLSLKDVEKRMTNQSPANQSFSQIIDRLLVGALNPVSEFSSYSMQYVVDFAAYLGMEEAKICNLIRKRVPELLPLPKEMGSDSIL
jgi:hypothetical protein